MRRAVVSFGYHYFNSSRHNSVKTASISSIVSIRPALLAAIVILTTGVPTASRADSASFQGLDVLSGYTESLPSGMSDDGSVVVGSSVIAGVPPNSQAAFRWTTSGGMVGLGHLSGDTYSEAVGVSADGSVVVGNSYSLDASGYSRTRTQAFRWTAAGGMVGLGLGWAIYRAIPQAEPLE